MKAQKQRTRAENAFFICGLVSDLVISINNIYLWAITNKWALSSIQKQKKLL
jgi:hypothetical protein